MILWELLNCAEYFQPLSVYITNAADQNLLIGRGTRKEIVDEEKTTVFDHMMDEVEMWRIRNNRMLIFIRDKHFDEYVEEQFSNSDSWGEEPEKRPWRYSRETELYTDKYIKVIQA